MTPGEKARQTIDGLLVAAGCTVQNRADANIEAAPGAAVREFLLGTTTVRPTTFCSSMARVLGWMRGRRKPEARGPGFDHSYQRDERYGYPRREVPAS